MSKMLTAHSRRGLAVALALAATLWLAACGGSGKTASSQTSASSTTSAAEAPSNPSTTKKNYPHSTLLAAARVGVITITNCLREHGIKVPPQKVSGPEPLFSSKGIDTTTPQYRAAYTPCLGKAIIAYKARLAKG